MTPFLQTRGLRHCPACGARAGIRIIYGSPPMEVYFLHERGEVVLGECRRDKSSPNWHCKVCGHRWVERAERAMH
ncbi:MAG: hypothetical protein JEZ02_12830 [Desulfatibacillum sp.]|nr:hypothetical protein [Desulfatibacillum sp.]